MEPVRFAEPRILLEMTSVLVRGKLVFYFLLTLRWKKPRGDRDIVVNFT